MRLLHTGVMGALLAAGPMARAQSVTPLFVGSTQPGVTPVHAMAMGTNGSGFLVCGRFSYVSGKEAQNLAMLNRDGTLAGRVTPSPPTGTILAATFDAPRNRFLFAGSISNTAEGVQYLGVLSSSGTLLRAEYWPGTEPKGHIRALAQCGDTIWVGGSFTSFAGVARQNLAQLSALTGVPTDFSLPADSTVNVFSVLGDDTLLVGGAFTNIGAETRRGLARLNPATGALHTNYADGFAGGPVYAIAPFHESVYVGGLFTSMANQVCGRIAKLDAATGARDLTATGGVVGSGAIYTIAPAGTNHLLVGGNFLNYSGNGQRYLALVHTNLDRVPAYTSGVDGIIHAALAVSPTSTLVSGRFTQYQDFPALGLVEILADSWLRHPGFRGSVGGPGDVYALAELPDGSVAVGGTFHDIGGQPTRNLARLNRDGTFCQAFTSNGPNGQVYALASAVFEPETTRVFYAGGAFTNVGPNPAGRLARYNYVPSEQTYRYHTTSVVNCQAPVRALAANSNHVFAGGEFAHVNGDTNRQYVFRFGHTNLVPDAGFQGYTGEVYSLVLHGTNLYAGGSMFNMEHEKFWGFVRKVSAEDGAPTAGFNAPMPNAPVWALHWADTNLYAGGDFTIIGPHSANYLARYNTETGARDETYDMHADYSVYTLASSSQNFFAGGYFTSFNTTSRWRLARFDAASGQLQAGYSNLFSGKVTALLPQGSRLWAGGNFNAVGTNSAASLALLGWPQFQGLRRTPEGFEIEIAGAPGQRGTVESAAALNAPSWGYLTNYAVGPEEDGVVVFFTTNAARSFYRALEE